MATMTDTPRRVTGGVDTHKDRHVAAALDDVGRILATDAFPAIPAGYRQLPRSLETFGTLAAVGVEGTGSWGAGLNRFLSANAVTVIEVTARIGSIAAATASPNRPTPSAQLERCSPAKRQAPRSPKTAAWRRSGCCESPDAAPSRPTRRPPTSSTRWSTRRRPRCVTVWAT